LPMRHDSCLYRVRSCGGSSSEMFVSRRRAVLPAPTLYPSFSPADFPATRDAAQQALRLARDAVAAHPDSPVSTRTRVKIFADCRSQINTCVLLTPGLYCKTWIVTHVSDWPLPDPHCRLSAADEHTARCKDRNTYECVLLAHLRQTPGGASHN